MRLTILGSGTSVPSSRRGSPAVLLRAGSLLALVDSGPGALRQLARLGVGLHDLTDLFYTHAHPDHTGDLWAFLFASRNPALGPRPALRLHGSAGFFDFYRRVARALGAWVEPAGYRLEEWVHDGEPRSLGGLTVRGLPVEHIASSLAWRFESAAGVVVVSGDTDYGPGIVAAARDADWLVLECATPEGAKLEGHLTPRLCGRIAAEARVRRLCLTHFYPQADAADVASELRAAWPGECVLAEDFLELGLDRNRPPGLAGP